MIVSVKNKQMPGIVQGSNLSSSDKKDILDNMPQFISHIENNISGDRVKQILVEALGTDFLREWRFR